MTEAIGKRRLRGRLAGVLLAATVLSGCAATQQHEREVEVPPAEMELYLSDKPAELHRLYAKVLTQGERNAVLNQMRAGLAAMQIGAWDTAERSFDKALLGIETVYADSEQAEDARSTWVKENYKAFKGEPYERMMAYYYRGLLYLREGDYENARASFKGGLLQDTLAQQETYSQDAALLAYLSGWASHCSDDPGLAFQAFEEAQEYNDELDPPGEDANLLLVGETGLAPRKVAVGEYDEALAFERAKGFRDRAVEMDIATEPNQAPREVELSQAEDIYFQASTRGGRQIDRILEGQAQFKQSSDAVGDAAIQGGAAAITYGAYDDNSGAMAAGLAVMAAGLIAKGIAAATRPEADLRAWDNLPDRVHLAAVTAEQMPQEVVARFTDGGGLAMARARAPVTQARPCALAWARAHSATDIPDAAPGSTAD
jgi:tetratricopeptide (TPR) repeat protein